MFFKIGNMVKTIGSDWEKKSLGLKCKVTRIDGDYVCATFLEGEHKGFLTEAKSKYFVLVKFKNNSLSRLILKKELIDTMSKK